MESDERAFANPRPLKRNDPRCLGEQRRNILLAAARFIAEHGYHGMSMRALAKATGRSLATEEVLTHE